MHSFLHLLFLLKQQLCLRTHCHWQWAMNHMFTFVRASKIKNLGPRFLCTYKHIAEHDCSPQYFIHLEMSFVHACTPWCASACTSYSSMLLFPLKLTYINQGQLYYNLNSRCPFNVSFFYIAYADYTKVVFHVNSGEKINKNKRLSFKNK